MENIRKIKLVGHVPSGGNDPRKTLFAKSNAQRIFLLSPANTGSSRGAILLDESRESVFSARLRAGSASLGELFSFISGLYFRGKLSYARAFASPPRGIPGAVVITASGGLVPPDKLLTFEGLRELAAGPIDPADTRYRLPLERDARLLRDHLESKCEIVLLGSIATAKYVDPLLSIFGDRLKFPLEFVGRGEMSRGGLLLRCVRERSELTYIPVAGAVRRGGRPTHRAKRTR